MTGSLFIVCAPSGAGKSSLVNAMLKEAKDIALSVSYTTRSPRPGEADGREYHFVDRAVFDAMLTRGEFLESAEVHGNYYATSQAWISAKRAEGIDIILEIDWQGAQQVRRIFPEAIGIFIMAPSLAELERRVRARGGDSEEAIKRRMAAASDEMSHAPEFNYVIINQDFEEAKRDLVAVVRTSRLGLARQSSKHPHLFT
jgi:guanylate kinase